MKLNDLLDLFYDEINVNLYYYGVSADEHFNGCSGVMGADCPLIRNHGDNEIAWLEMDRQGNSPDGYVLNIGLYEE